jgi:hypothetical protein
VIRSCLRNLRSLRLAETAPEGTSSARRIGPWEVIDSLGMGFMVINPRAAPRGGRSYASACSPVLAKVDDSMVSVVNGAEYSTSTVCPDMGTSVRTRAIPEAKVARFRLRRIDQRRTSGSDKSDDGSVNVTRCMPTTSVFMS